MGKANKREYKLWWEYLKLSDDYEELCEFHRKQKKNPKLILPEKFQRKRPVALQLRDDPQGYVIPVDGMLMNVKKEILPGHILDT